MKWESTKLWIFLIKSCSALSYMSEGIKHEGEKRQFAQRARHRGMDMCGNLSLVSQHMSGWPCTGYYSNSGAIDSNPLFLLVWNLIIPQHVFTRNYPKNRYLKPRLCCSSYCISLSAFLKTCSRRSGGASQGKNLCWRMVLILNRNRTMEGLTAGLIYAIYDLRQTEKWAFVIGPWWQPDLP